MSYGNGHRIHHPENEIPPSEIAGVDFHTDYSHTHLLLMCAKIPATPIFKHKFHSMLLICSIHFISFVRAC